MIFDGDPRLLLGYRAGDPAALTAVYHAYVGELALLVRRGFVTGTTWVPPVTDPHEQCDLLQEAFVRAFSETARQNYHAGSPFRPYLLRILKNLIIDRLRRSGREISASAGPAEGGLDLDAVITANQPLPAEELRSGEARLLAAAAEYAASLGGEQAEYYRLRYRDELPQLTVAVQMQITRRRARTLEDQLRSGLKSYLAARDLL